MLTDNGSVKTKSIEVAPALDLYRKKLKLICIIFLIAGAIGLVAYIALSVVFEIKWLDVLLIFAVPFTLGLIGTITIVRLHRRETQAQCVSESEFYADCFFCYSTVKGESLVDKVAYPDAVLKCENEKYGYIFVFSKGLFLVFSKEDLTVAEINAIRKNFRKEADGNIAKLDNFIEDKGEQK